MRRNSVRYSDSVTKIICERLENGESLATICKDKNMPSLNGFNKWLKKYPALVDDYARAREIQAHYFAAQIIDIADNSSNETYQRDRLRLDARKWYASKVAPKSFGDKTTISGDSEAPISITISKTDNDL